ncbi:tyrosine recombinase XerC [Clostridium sp. HCP1S3_B4]|uniref:tyrosine recombinase XerC n=1 Tax=unclassified Clostridium TaxID=2614128 RepID=UPI00169AFC14|nr:tyrosine recombinase XerC [Clostridiales bacterium]MDY2728942.1 tyrosine recombinase XerC [Clostridium sp.]NLK22679.1 tyrosine recombinase XerC [Clostridiales bacterium]
MKNDELDYKNLVINLEDFRDDNILNEEYPECVNDYIKYMDTIKGSSKNTINSYVMDIIIMLKFLKYKKGLVEKNINFKDINVHDITNDFLNKITLDDMHSFLIFEKRYFDNGNSTIARKVASMRSFFKYLNQKAKIIKNNYTDELERPKIGKRKPKYMNLDEANSLLNSIDSRNFERDFLIVTLFLNCGMRLAELCSIKITDIKDDTIRIIGKGNKERTVYLNEACLKAIENYKPIRAKLLHKKNITNQDALIISERGNAIARRTVQEVIENQLKKAGLSGKGYSTHKLRHTAATLMYKYGDVDILVLQEILGHESVSTTQIYTHTDNDMLREAVKVNPLNISKE